jgi:hypothetical protein
VTTQVLTVALDPSDAAASRTHRTVLASLPTRFRAAAGGAADVLLVSGDVPGWDRRAHSAFGSGARAIMLTGTDAVSAEAVRSLGKEAEAAGVLVAVDTDYAADPGWAAARPLLAADVAGSVVLDCIVTFPAPDRGADAVALLRSALVQQLAVIRPLLADLPGPSELTAAHASGRSYVVAGLVQGIAVTLAGTASGTGDSSLRLDLAGSSRHWRAEFDADPLANPARISVDDSDGNRALPPVYESSHRAAWADLHSAVPGAGSQPVAVSYPAEQHARDLALAEATLERT